MKSALFALLSILLLGPSQGTAGTDVIDFPAELSASFASVPGRVVLAGDQVLFWTTAANYPSFYIPKAVIERSNLNSGVLTVQTSQPVQVQDGSRSRFDFRVQGTADAAAIERWFATEGTPTTAGRGTPPSNVTVQSPDAAEYSYNARRKKLFGDNRGKLMFTPNTVVWESFDDASNSRTWSYKQVRSLDRKNPYELEVKLYTEGTYNFDLIDNPLNDSAFNWITDQLATARAATRDQR